MLLTIFQEIWFGMLAGTTVQTGVLIMMVLRTNWNKEVRKAYIKNQTVYICVASKSLFERNCNYIISDLIVKKNC